MGEIRNYICYICGYTWSRAEGRGFRAVSLHCDNCGNEKMVDLDEVGQEHICECGGKLSAESGKIICPKCLSDHVDLADDTVMMWD